jgi:cytochrome c2
MRGIDAFTLNTVAGWVLGAGLLVFGLNELAHVVYHAETPERPGMIVEIADVAPDVDEVAPDAPHIAELLAQADADRGQAASRACAACHTFEQGEPHRIGPNLWDVVGLPIAHHDDYSYSAALQARSDETWTFEALDQFIANPRGFAAGTTMAYAGMRRDDQRADLLAYLRTLSDDPQPLPEAPEPEAEPEAQVAPEPDVAPDEPQVAELLAQADADRGQAASRACAACHTFEQGGPHRIGPNLWGIVGEQFAHHDDYSYSAALQARSDETWTIEALDQFIANPREFAPGTTMAYAGMRRDDQRADLLAYLSTLSDDPQPLPEAPEPEAEPAPEPEAEPEAEPAPEPEAELAPEPDVAPAEEENGIAQLLAGVDAERGQAVARACQACHTFDEGGGHRIGPNLWDIVGQPIAHHDDYSYSDALRARSDETWTYEALDQFLGNPREFAPGTTMAFAGVRRDEQRLELIAYLRTLSADPQPLP